jgi:hypothetical protein
MPLMCKTHTLRVVANLSFRFRAAQDLVRESGALTAVMSHTYVDPEQPLMREAAIFCLRNLTEGCPANQEAISALQVQKVSRATRCALRDAAPEMGVGAGPRAQVVRSEELASMGMEARVDTATGRVRVGPVPKDGPPKD